MNDNPDFCNQNHSPHDWRFADFYFLKCNFCGYKIFCKDCDPSYFTVAIENLLADAPDKEDVLVLQDYTVRWEIEITAETPEEAAQKALTIQRDTSSLATAFLVEDGADTFFIDFNHEP